MGSEAQTQNNLLSSKHFFLFWAILLAQEGIICVPLCVLCMHVCKYITCVSTYFSFNSFIWQMSVSTHWCKNLWDIWVTFIFQVNIASSNWQITRESYIICDEFEKPMKDLELLILSQIHPNSCICRWLTCLLEAFLFLFSLVVNIYNDQGYSGSLLCYIFFFKQGFTLCRFNQHGHFSTFVFLSFWSKPLMKVSRKTDKEKQAYSHS